MALSHSSARTQAKVDQACAIPFRRNSGRLEFCLITSSSGRWIFPKGFIDSGRSSDETALSEAFEEAGLRGRITGKPLGYYDVSKAGGTYTVMASLMEVKKCEKHWPEEDWRQRRWVSQDAATELLAQPELVKFLKAAAKRLSS
ncbi:MAG: NUDIX hydrolase [Pirellulaceae bacterium]